jgi:acetyltransferase-like isoleucine patch superfamily enzyme
MLRTLAFWITARRIGPDLPLSHLLLYSKGAGRWLARRKLRHFGDGAQIRPHAYLVECAFISIGRNVVVRPGCKFFAVPHEQNRGDITIDDDVLIGSDVHIYVSNHRFDDVGQDIYAQGHSAPSPVRLKQGCWVGAGAIILPGVTIGRNAVVGAGSVVSRDVPDYCIAAGSPARVLRRLKP